MSITVICPDGHPVELDKSRLGSIVACPRCFATFYADTDLGMPDYARAEKGRARPSRDDDDDDDEDDDEDDDDDDEDERPKKKAKPARKNQDDDDEDDDDEEDDDTPTGPLSKKQRNLQMVQLGLTLIMWAIICFLFLPLAGVLQALVVGFALVADMPWLMYITLGMTGTSFLAIDILMLVGISFGFWMPRNSEVRSTIFGNITFGILMLFFALLGVLGFSQIIIADPEVSRRFGLLCFGLTGLCELIFFLTVMVYLKKVASFFKDMLLASEPINLLIEFTVWYVIPQAGDFAIGQWTNGYRNLDALTFIIVGLFSLFYLFAFIRSYFLLFRWIHCVVRIRDLVDRTIKDM